MAHTRYRKIGNNVYVYHQWSERIAGKVVTKEIYIGRMGGTPTMAGLKLGYGKDVDGKWKLESYKM